MTHGIKTWTESSVMQRESIDQLAVAKGRLKMHGSKIDVLSDEGHGAVVDYLAALEKASGTLMVKTASRSYRQNFTVNYRALFSDETRNYRADIFEASLGLYDAIWVNGAQVGFSTESMRLAEVLQDALAELNLCLSDWEEEEEEEDDPIFKPTHDEIQNRMAKVDLAWADFESQYVFDLISVEDSARQVIVHAIKQEHRLQYLEATIQDPTNSAWYRKEVDKLVEYFSQMNLAARGHPNSRGDFSAGIYFSARAVIEGKQSCDMQDQAQACAAQMLAAHAVETFEAVRRYLQSVTACLEKVDPQLCNNAGLVNCLADWEESWKTASKYLQNTAILHSVGNIVSALTAAQKASPRLIDMLDRCDAELFMVLPRIVWMKFLVDSQQVAALFMALLPKRFGKCDIARDTGLSEGGVNEEEVISTGDADIIALLKNYRALENSLGGHLDVHASSQSIPGLVWNTLVNRLIFGESCNDAYDHLPAASRMEAERAVEDFARQLERYSIELQRGCPDDWNQCCAVLVRCLNSGAEERDQDQLHV